MDVVPAKTQVGLNCAVPATCELMGQFETVSLPAPACLTHPGYFVRAAVLNPNNGLLQPVTNTPWLELRTLDSATAPHSAGTQIPLPHIDEFSSSEMFFPHIPLNGHSRLKLRLYGVEAWTSGAWSSTRTTRPACCLPESCTSRDGRYDLTGAIAGQVPSYAEVDLPALLDVSAVRVAVSPLLPAGRLVWGFVTITDNQSEQVTIATPTAPMLTR